MEKQIMAILRELYANDPGDFETEMMAGENDEWNGRRVENRLREFINAQPSVQRTCSQCGGENDLHEDDCPVAAEMVHQSAQQKRVSDGGNAALPLTDD